MNVLFHCFEFPPQAGGVGSYVANMAASLRATGHGVTVVTGRWNDLPAREEGPWGVVYRLYRREDMYAPHIAREVLDIAARHRADVIEGADHYGEASALFSCANRPPVVVRIHGSNPIRIVQNAQVYRPWQWLTVRLAHARNWKQTLHERRAIQDADMVIAPCGRMIEEVERQGLRLPAKRGVVPNPAPALAVASPADESADPLIFLPARLEIRKGIQYLRALLDRLIPRFPSLVLEIAGDDSYARGLGSLQAWLIEQMGEHRSHLRFLGVLSPADMARAYGRAWVVILPSRWDNFPTVLLEAMARAKPVVSSPNGGMPEMLEGTLCRTVDPGSPAFADEVARLLGDAELRRRAGESMRAKTERAYSPPVVVGEYVRLLSAWGVGAPR